jgi:hypothetical protein
MLLFPEGANFSWPMAQRYFRDCDRPATFARLGQSFEAVPHTAAAQW